MLFLIKFDLGELTMVIGEVGGGKSSLLSVLLGEMTTLSGTVSYGDSEGFVLEFPSEAPPYNSVEEFSMQA